MEYFTKKWYNNAQTKKEGESMFDIITILKSMVLAAVPIIEQKAAIPLAISWGMSNYEAYFYTLIGAVLPAPFILLFIPKIFEYLKKFNKLGELVTWYENRSLKKGKNIVKYEMLGLFFFVAIPLPFTGVWTGTTVAALLKLNFKKSLLTVFLGAMACGFIILLVYMGIVSIFWLN